MKPTIKVSFYLESHEADIPAVGSILQIEPSCWRTEFPPTSIAVPWWKTEVEEKNYDVAQIVQLLLDRLQPKTEMIQKIIAQHRMRPYLVIKITARYENGPAIYLLPEQTSYFASLGAQIDIDLDALYPD